MSRPRDYIKSLLMLKRVGASEAFKYDKCASCFDLTAQSSTWGKSMLNLP